MTLNVNEGSSAGSPALGPAPSSESGSQLAAGPRMVAGLVGLIGTGYLMYTIFLSFSLRPEWWLDSRVLIGVVAICVGVGGAALLFWFLNMFVEALPGTLSRLVIPYAFLLPGLGLITLMLLFPTIQTVIFSFADEDSETWVGLDNYRTIFASSEFRATLVNNVLWLALVPAAVVSIGIVVAVMADKLSKRGESLAKSVIFLSMTISFVGASAIWSLVYNYSAGDNQTGILNAIWTSLGGSAQTWLQNDSFKLNALLLMVILVWLQAGFGMILMSSAIKGVPEDTIEAARIDGASEWQIFWRIVLPQIKGTTITVFITVLIMVLKVFDIVYVLTNGRFDTNVIANLFFFELFAKSSAGTASAIVVVLLVAITPVLVYQVRHFRAEDAKS